MGGEGAFGYDAHLVGRGGSVFVWGQRGTCPECAQSRSALGRTHASHHPAVQKQPNRCSTNSPHGQVGLAGGELAPHPPRPQLGGHHLRPCLVLEAGSKQSGTVQDGARHFRTGCRSTASAFAQHSVCHCTARHSTAQHGTARRTCGWPTRR